MEAIDYADFIQRKSQVGEKEFMTQVVAYARLRGYREYHVHFSQRSQPGFPDLILVRCAMPGRSGRIVYLELKVRPNKLTVAQSQWINDINAAGGIAAVIYPEQWNELVKLLE